MEITINFIGDEYPSMAYMFSHYVKIIVRITHQILFNGLDICNNLIFIQYQ